MKCDLLKPAGAPETNPNSNGSWEYQQDPDSGAITRRWRDFEDTPEINEARPGLIIPDVPLMARGVLTGGFKNASNSQLYSEIYKNIEWLKAIFPKDVNITEKDRVTNIRNKTGEVIWKEEEANAIPATTFNVMGVTPILDPFNNMIELSVLLQRSEVQGG